MGDELAAWLRLEGSAALHGAYRWAELRLYQLTGAWAGVPDVVPEVRVHLFEMSARHGWHADLWAARLPALDGVDPEGLTRPLGAIGPLLDALAAAGPTPGERGSERRWMAGLYRVVLPRLLVTYRSHGAGLPAVSHGPTARALSLVVRDEEEQLSSGESLVQGLLSTAEDVETAVAALRALELVVVNQGGGPGLVGRWEGVSGEPEGSPGGTT